MSVIERYSIFACESKPAIQFLYINGPHQIDSWIHLIDISHCKINMFVKGLSTIIVNGHPYIASAGDILIYRPHDIHYGRIPYEQNIEYFEFLFEPEALNCIPGGTELIRLFVTDPNDNLPTALIRISEDNIRRLTERFYYLLNIVRSDLHAKNIVALSVVIDILNLICAVRKSAYIVDSSDTYPVVLVKALEYISQHFTEHIDNNSISAACNISRTYLNTIFREYLNCTPHEYIVSCRLTYARSCLDRRMSVTEAAYLSGFPDCSSFGKHFRRCMGMSPSQYRRLKVH
jgi:AraC-like DNA-binding protein